jgi:hypothetical protein
MGCASTSFSTPSFLYCAPHTFCFGDDIAAMIRDAASVLAHVHVADTFNHKASSGLRYIVNPPGSTARVHQHLDIGQGEVGWDAFFGTLHEVGFDGIMTACVFAWEERAVASSRFMRQEMKQYVDKYWSFRGAVRTRLTALVYGELSELPISRRCCAIGRQGAWGSPCVRARRNSDAAWAVTLPLASVIASAVSTARAGSN